MSQNTARWTLLAIFGLFFIPLLAAMLMWSGQIEWRPGGMRNHGDLIQPPAQIAVQVLQAADAYGKWVLLIDAGKQCDETCLRRASELRQVRRATGRQMDKVAVAVRDGGLAEMDVAQLTAISTEFVLLKDHSGALIAALRATNTGTGHAWLLDPNGLAILSYNPAVEATGIHKDLKRLLTWSKAE